MTIGHVQKFSCNQNLVIKMGLVMGAKLPPNIQIAVWICTFFRKNLTRNCSALPEVLSALVKFFHKKTKVQSDAKRP
jgi:hypothetical protein